MKKKKKATPAKVWGLRWLKTGRIMKRVYGEELDADCAAEQINWDRLKKMDKLVKVIRIEIREIVR